MTPQDFSYLQSLMLRRARIALWTEKQYLAEVRLTALAAELALPASGDVVARARAGDAEVERRVVEALTTNETYFFRDPAVFELLDTVVVPRLIAARASARRLRIWCSAVSSGQEAYSVAMVLARHRRALAGWKVDVLGSDLSRAMIARATAGRYSHFEVQRGLPVRELLEHFRRDGDNWDVSDALRGAVEFRVMNLVDELPALAPFDLVLCRNLLIYLDMKAKAAVLGKIARATSPDGWVLLGAAESVVGLNAGLAPDPVHRGLYVREDRSTPVAARA